MNTINFGIMLISLEISNYAIIQSLSIRFDKGLIVMTGETGAGKSIIIGALNLIMGERADSSMILNGQEKCTIEAVFHTKYNHRVQDFLVQNDLEVSDEVIIRREINRNGRSRSFINDTPVNLSQLSEICQDLIDMHRQYDNVEMKKNDQQLQIIDALLAQPDLLAQYQDHYKKVNQLAKEISSLETELKSALQSYDYNKFQFEELDNLNIKDDELETLEFKVQELTHAHTIIQSIDHSQNIISDQEQAILPQLKTVISILEKASAHAPSLEKLIERLHGCKSELADVYELLNDTLDNLQNADEPIELLEERFNLLTRIAMKHGVKTTGELLELKNKFKESLVSNDLLAQKITALKQEKEVQDQLLLSSAQELSLSRNKIVKDTIKKVNGLLPKVGMPNAKFAIESTIVSPHSHGQDKIVFLLDANNSGTFSPLQKVASGGELSRLALCIKSLLASKIHLPTLVFDEIDTGISGETAKQVSILMNRLAQDHQLIVVTHLPQIAAKSNQHLYVYKSGTDQLNTQIKTLNQAERQEQIAEMLSGKKPTAAALQSAKELMEGVHG